MLSATIRINLVVIGFPFHLFDKGNLSKAPMLSAIAHSPVRSS
jgi:hypothetical protein